MRVEVETETKFDHGNPEELYKGNYLGILSTNCFPYDVHPDGKRFLMMKSALSAKDPTASTGPRKINIVLNWDLELKQLVPVD